MSKVSVVIQARMGSSRLPGKMSKKIYNKTSLEHIIFRLKDNLYIDKIIIATSSLEKDNYIDNFCKKNHYLCFRGSEANCLKRFYDCANEFKLKHIVRICGDCPMLDNDLLEDMIQVYFKNNLQYYYYPYKASTSFPDGFVGEILSYDILKEAYNNTNNNNDLQHVTPYLKRNYTTLTHTLNIDLTAYKNIDFNNLHLSLDTEKDLDLLSKIFQYFDKKKFNIVDVLEYLNN
jgi:spore coat polysaccharide biosynthesis protein SpsF